MGSDLVRLSEGGARSAAEQMCAALRHRGDKLSLDAAAEIEGTLEAFAGLVRAQIDLRERLANTERNLRGTLDLWARVPRPIRSAVVHGDKCNANRPTAAGAPAWTDHGEPNV